MNWKVFPFLRITFSFLLGILLHEATLGNQITCYILSLFGALIFLCYCFSFVFLRCKRIKNLNIVLGLACFVAFGFFSSHLRKSFNKPNAAPYELAEVSFYFVEIKSNVILTGKTAKYEAEIQRMKLDEAWIELKGKVILYFTNEIDNRFSYGDQLLIRGNPQWIKNQTNPYAFDYGKFLQRKGFYLRDYINQGDFHFIDKDYGFSIARYSLLAGNYFEQILAKYIPNDRELDIARAMLLGRRYEISEEMQAVYQSSGTAHILAVSGLHVGILFFILSWLLTPLKNRRMLKYYYGCIIILIWAFAFLTGNSPSVQRAALMLSVILIAKIISRRSNIYNSIFFSGFVILLHDPNLIFSVSFQLSFAAVIGIVYLYRKIYTLVYLKNRFLNFFWKITVLSIAAQIATLPISIYYFHQFPTLSLVTNLIAIPTAIFILSGGLVLLVGSIFPPIAQLVGDVCSFWIYFYNEGMSFVSRLELAAVEGLYVKELHVFVIILFIISMIRFIETRRIIFIKSMAFTLLVFASWNLYFHQEKSQQKQMVLYDVKGKSYFDVFHGNVCFTNAPSNAEDVAYSLKPNRRNNLISEVKSIEAYDQSKMIGSNRLVMINQNLVLFLKEPNEVEDLPNNMVLDYLILDNNSARDIDLIRRKFRFKFLLLDSSVPLILASRIKNSSEGPSMIHAISQDGAFQISI